jgi:hypothetical protein
MNLLSRAFLLVAAILFIGVLGAQAQEVQFSLTGPVDATAVVFTDPAAAGEITSSDVGTGFTLTPLSLTVGGVALPLGNLGSDYSLTFYNVSPITGGGGFSALTNDGLTDAFATFGPQLYTGPENDPSFASLIGAGPISLGDFDTGTAGAYSLTVTAVTPVGSPEPSTLLLLAAALVPLGFLAKRLL